MLLIHQHCHCAVSLSSLESKQASIQRAHRCCRYCQRATRRAERREQRPLPTRLLLEPQPPQSQTPSASGSEQPTTPCTPPFSCCVPNVLTPPEQAPRHHPVLLAHLHRIAFLTTTTSIRLSALRHASGRTALPSTQGVHQDLLRNTHKHTTPNSSSVLSAVLDITSFAQATSDHIRATTLAVGQTCHYLVRIVNFRLPC